MTCRLAYRIHRNRLNCQNRAGKIKEYPYKEKLRTTGIILSVAGTMCIPLRISDLAFKFNWKNDTNYEFSDYRIISIF